MRSGFLLAVGAWVMAAAETTGAARTAYCGPACSVVSAAGSAMTQPTRLGKLLNVDGGPLVAHNLLTNLAYIGIVLIRRFFQRGQSRTCIPNLRKRSR